MKSESQNDSDQLSDVGPQSDPGIFKEVDLFKFEPQIWDKEVAKIGPQSNQNQSC